MTDIDIFNLRNDCLYEFTSYNGKKHYGIYTKDKNNNSYIIHGTATNIRAWNDSVRNKNPLAYENHGTKINPDAIYEHKVFTPDSTISIDLSKAPSFDGTKAKKLVIFGAGASFGSLNEFTGSLKKKKRFAPLANQLFDESFSDIYEHYAGVQASLSKLRREKDIELYFQKEWDFISNHNDPLRLKRLISLQYYLHDLMNHVSVENDWFDHNNYDTLISTAYDYTIRHKEKVLLTTFNYDTLLERSLSRVSKITFETLDDYINNSKNLYCYKLHGSCNWGWTINTTLQQGSVLNNVRDMAAYVDELLPNLAVLYYNWIDDLEKINLIKKPAVFNYEGKQVVFHNSIKDYLYYPALFLPFKQKDDFVLPQNHHVSLNHYLDSVEDVLIIGWKGEEVVFNDLLKKRLKGKKIRLTIVAPEAALIWKKMETVFDGIEFKPFRTFSEFIKDSGDEEFFFK